MSEREKTFLGFLGLFISVLIFGVIIFHTIDISSIKVNVLGRKIISYLCENQYEKFYENLSSDVFTDIDKFTTYQENINQMLGDIQSYKSIGFYKNNTDGENDFRIDYDVNFSKFSNEKVKMILNFKGYGSEWKVSQYKYQLEGANSNSELVQDINYLNTSLKEENKEIDEAKKIGSDFIQNYNNENYKYIYLMLNNELKEKGNERDFINYLQNKYNMYGEISDSKFCGYEIGKDKLEFKLNYYFINAKVNKKVYMTLWVQMKDKPYLSGINFSENIWN